MAMARRPWRYTEVRLEKMAEAMLEDIDKETVDFQLNFDDSMKEPTVFAFAYSQPVAQRVQRYCGRYGHQHYAAQSF